MESRATAADGAGGGACAVFEELWRTQVRFHGADDAHAPSNLKLRRGILDFLLETVKEGDHTLETGCGYSTVIFAAHGARHIAIAPFESEHRRIREWLTARGVDLEGLRFIAEPSQRVLPSLETPPLDLVLIDGDHSFPAPFIDWYYTATRLKVGGLLVVDDTNIVTGAILRDFLAADRARWRLRLEFKRTAVFEKLIPEVLEGLDWPDQPYCARKIRYPRFERLFRPLGRLLFRRAGR